MTMQNKLYTIQFFSPPNDQSKASTPAAIAECQACEFLRISQNFWKSANSQKSSNSWKSLNSWTREDSNSWRQEKADSCPQSTPIHKLSMMFMVWNISIGQPGSLPGCAPSQLLHTHSWAEYEKLEKSLWFHRNNWKHQCYLHSSHTKSKIQQLLGGKLTLTQPKPGQVLSDVMGFSLCRNVPSTKCLGSLLLQTSKEVGRLILLFVLWEGRYNIITFQG